MITKITLTKDNKNAIEEMISDIYRVNNVNDNMVARFLHVLYDSLFDQQYEVVAHRYGLYDGCLKTLEEVSKLTGLTREMVRQILAKSIRKMLHPLRRNKVVNNL